MGNIKRWVDASDASSALLCFPSPAFCLLSSICLRATAGGCLLCTALRNGVEQLGGVSAGRGISIMCWT